MPSPYLMYGILPITIGGSIATAIGCYVALSNNLGFANNYLVKAWRAKPDEWEPTYTCSFLTSCLLFNLQTEKPLEKSELAEIKAGNRYVLNLDDPLLKANSLVELQLENQKLFFEVLSAPTKDKTLPLKPTPPEDLITHDELIKRQKDYKKINSDSSAIRTRRYLNDLAETYITREGVDHQEYLILQWGIRGDVSFFQDNTEYLEISKQLQAKKIDSEVLSEELQKIPIPLVDKYVFNTFADQEALAAKGHSIKIQINKEEHQSFLEIYEIKDQTSIIASIEELKKDDKSKLEPDWASIAKENTMVTKMTEMEKGKYYKFVIKDFSKFATTLKKPLEGFHIREEIPTATGSTRPFIFSRDDDSDVNYYCTKFASAAAGLKNKCAKAVNTPDEWRF